MVQAFVMVRTEAGTPQDVREALETIETVEEAHVVAGEYDIIAEVTGETVYDVLDATSDEIQAIDGVLETKTYMSMSE